MVETLLPIGWQEVEPVGIPSDVGTPEDEWDSTASPKKPRKETRRWVRGVRYVRICVMEDEEDKEPRFVLHRGIIGDEDGDGFRHYSEDFKEIFIKAKALMRVGGY